MIPFFTRAYEADTDIEGYRIVSFSDAASSKKVSHSAAGTDAHIGVSDAMGADAGGMCDVHRGGLVSVQLGGAVNAGDLLTADADGKAVAAAAVASTTIRIIGYADEPGVADDIIDAFLAPGILHEA